MGLIFIVISSNTRHGLNRSDLSAPKANLHNVALKSQGFNLVASKRLESNDLLKSNRSSSLALYTRLCEIAYARASLGKTRHWPARKECL